MIDKVDVRIPEFASPGPALAEAFEGLRKHPVPPFRPSRHYQYVCDLRDDFDVDAVVHLFLRHGRPTHKVEIIDAGDRTVEDMADIIAKLFVVDPLALGLMRVDLAADLDGVPVPWFKDHAYVSRKQFSSRIEKSFEQELEFVGMGTAQAQTLYAGKRPSLMRIYDKLAEWRMQLRKLEKEYRRFNALMEGMDMTAEQRYYGVLIPPTFTEYCRARGYDYQTGNILTRIESQIGGNRLPPELATFNDLRYAHELTPFDGLQIVGSDRAHLIDSPPEEVPVRNWLAALGFEALKEHLGSAQFARSFVLKHGKGNGKRILQSLAECCPVRPRTLTTEEIQESFKQSTLLQTSHLDRQGVHLSPTYEHSEQIA